MLDQLLEDIRFTQDYFMSAPSLDDEMRGNQAGKLAMVERIFSGDIDWPLMPFVSILLFFVNLLIHYQGYKSSIYQVTSSITQSPIVSQLKVMAKYLQWTHKLLVEMEKTLNELDDVFDEIETYKLQSKGRRARSVDTFFAKHDPILGTGLFYSYPWNEVRWAYRLDQYSNLLAGNG